MTTERVAPPAALAVSLAAAKVCLRIDDTDTSLDLQISTWIKGITAEAEHLTGRAFVNRPMRVTLDAFPDSIRLSAPTYSVESVKYFDADGVERTLDPQDYYADKITKPGYIVPAGGKAFPTVQSRVNAVTVDYTAGYGLDDSTVPEEVALYVQIRLMEIWDPATREFKETQASNYAKGLLDGLVVYG